jgi:hypothetical protein
MVEIQVQPIQIVLWAVGIILPIATVIFKAGKDKGRFEALESRFNTLADSVIDLKKLCDEKITPACTEIEVLKSKVDTLWEAMIPLFTEILKHPHAKEYDSLLDDFKAISMTYNRTGEISPENLEKIDRLRLMLLSELEILRRQKSAMVLAIGIALWQIDVILKQEKE